MNAACAYARYLTPPNVHPAKDPYPDDVPIRAREWCYWSSREWVCLSFECRRISHLNAADVYARCMLAVCSI
jgi:hypothetical protein